MKLLNINNNNNFQYSWFDFYFINSIKDYKIKKIYKIPNNIFVFELKNEYSSKSTIKLQKMIQEKINLIKYLKE